MLVTVALSLGMAVQEPARRTRPSQRDATVAVGIFSQTYQHWRVDCSVAGIRDVRVAFDVRIAPDGSLIAPPVPVRPQESTAYQVAAASARRALLASAPFDVPDGYEGGDYRPIFRPDRVCREADED